jgi:dTDP-4-amino-4,6-dideoxygalactose transaminase
MNIPMLDLKSQYQSMKAEIDQKMLEVVASQRFILGDEVSALEQAVAEYSGARYGVGVSSGSDALIISLMALGVGEGDYVVTSPFTFFATAGAIARLKAVPIFCDIEEKSFNLDPEKLAELLDIKIEKRDISRIKAIIPIHLYGQITDMDPVLKLAEKYRLKIVEDAAQAIGAEYPGEAGFQKACTLGDMGILSFFPSKNLGAYGDGGMVLTGDEELAAKLKLLRTHGGRNKYFYDILGGNFRLDALQAAILRIKLKYLEGWQQARRERASTYHTLFQESGLVDKGAVQPPPELYKDSGVANYHTYHQYVIRARDRDKLQAFLKEKGIPSAIYYPLGLHQQKCFAYLGYKEGDFPVTEKATHEVLALPIYPELNQDQQEYVVQGIAEFYD